MSKDLNVLTPFFSHLDKTHGHNMYSSEWKPMTEKKKSRRIHAFLVNRQPLTKVTFETKQADYNNFAVERVIEIDKLILFSMLVLVLMTA